MKKTWIYVIAVAIFIAFVVAGVVVATLIHLKSPSFWILVGVFAALGLIGAGALLWWQRSSEAARGAGAGPDAAGGMTGDREVDFIFQQAEIKLRSAGLGRGSRIGKLPLILVAGETGSGKTSIVEESGLDPELLAGQVSQDGQVAPTRSVNLWYTTEALFAEAAGGLLSEPVSWTRLIRRIAPAGASSVVGGKGP
ncbi:MAG: hypothetical protein KGM47_01690, partial [Acidobacteriota bacterium]|nr:hypothetical protein [Acidobacteriota bacterium]